MTREFQGLAAILADRADLTGRHGSFFTVRPPTGEGFHIGIRFDRKLGCFHVSQSYPGSQYSNIFSVNMLGGVVAYCDHFPNGPIVEAVAAGMSLPKSTELFALKFCEEHDSVSFAIRAATQAIEQLEKWGELDANLRAEDYPRGGLGRER